MMPADYPQWLTVGAPILISLAALAASIYSAVQNRKANSNAGVANDKATTANTIAGEAKIVAEKALDKQTIALNYQDAALENQIYSSISTSLQFMIQASLALAATETTASNYAVVEQCYNTTVEGWLNAYETACLSYRNGKINKDTFKMGYQVSIRKLVQREDLESYFFPKEKSGYPSIHAVYNEWDLADK